MDLTPLDVRTKKEDLRRAVRGYDSVQVDAFLELVADRLDELVRSEVRLREEVRILREQLDVFRERERALNDALIAAQELREEARVQSEHAAQIRMRDAEHEAGVLVDKARSAVRDYERSLSDLGLRRASFLREMRSLLERYLGDVRLEEERRLGDETASVVPSDEGEAPSNWDRASAGVSVEVTHARQEAGE